MLFIIVYVHECLCTLCMPIAHRSQKRASDPLKLELQVAVRCHVSAENQTWVLKRRSQCSQPLGHLSSLSAVLKIYSK